MKYGHIPRGYTQVLRKMPFFSNHSNEECVFRRKCLTLIYICDMILKNIYIHQNFYINNENLLFSKFQHKITGKLHGLGKS